MRTFVTSQGLNLASDHYVLDIKMMKMFNLSWQFAYTFEYMINVHNDIQVTHLSRNLTQNLDFRHFTYFIVRRTISYYALDYT